MLWKVDGTLRQPPRLLQVNLIQLYYFFKDAKVGDTNGQGVGGVWFVIDPQAFPPGK